MVCASSSSGFPNSNQLHNEVNDTEPGSNHPDPWDNFLYPPLLNPENLFQPISTVSGDKCIDIFSSGSEKGRLITTPISSHLEGGAASFSTDKDPSKPILKYISQMLMEENTERHYMPPDPLVLEATEKSLHDALGENHPPCVNLRNEGSNFHSSGNINNSSNFHTLDFLSVSSITSEIMSTGGVIHGQNRALLRTRESNVPSPLSTSFRDCIYQLAVCPPRSQPSFSPPICFTNCLDDLLCPSTSTIQVPYMPNSNESALQFQRGQEEASKLLLNSIRLIDDVENKRNLSMMQRESAKAKVSISCTKARKNHEREDGLWMEEGRKSKVSAMLVEEEELSDLFDKLFRCTQSDDLPSHNDDKIQSRDFSSTRKLQGSNARLRTKKGENKKMVDLRNLLLLCAQAVSVNNMKASTEHLEQIRLHSSPTGDATQRLAHHFANGLEARLAATRDQNPFRWLIADKSSAVDKIKGYHTYFNACPFHMVAVSYSTNMIVKVSETAKALHIIDFGITYGFRCPLLIQLLAKRPGGPPSLRITGIEIPQQGFRPGALIEETGRNLARYCKNYGVPFVFHAITLANWETIETEEFKITPNEVLAVNCLYRFENLLDATVVENNPRNAVLNMIRAMRLDIFVISVTNGSYNSPFFLTRFKEALFHFSAIYDMIDFSVPRNNKERLEIEREVFGRKAMNVISCEGSYKLRGPRLTSSGTRGLCRQGLSSFP